MNDQNLKHICGVCEKEFSDEKGYLDHTCEVSSLKPTDPEHLVKTTTPNFKEASEAALERGNKRAELEAKGKTPEEAVVETREIGKVAQ
jgi:hypothetical protein